MIRSLINSSPAGALREGLSSSSQRLRAIANRVANATTPGGAQFPDALSVAEGEVATGEPVTIDIETEMIALADEQLRYQISARILQRVYQGLRMSVGRS